MSTPLGRQDEPALGLEQDGRSREKAKDVRRRGLPHGLRDPMNMQNRTE